MLFSFFFFNDTATTEIYTLSLHDALPISLPEAPCDSLQNVRRHFVLALGLPLPSGESRRRNLQQRGYSETQDRKSTRLNSSHGYISYAVFCLKKKKETYASQQYTLETRID